MKELLQLNADYAARMQLLEKEASRECRALLGKENGDYAFIQRFNLYMGIFSTSNELHKKCRIKVVYLYNSRNSKCEYGCETRIS